MFKNMKLGQKIIAGFCLASIITLAVGITGYVGATRLGSAIDNVAVTQLPSIFGLGIMNEAQTAVQRAERTFLIPGVEQKYMDAQKEYLKEAWANADKGWKIYEPLPQVPEEAKLWKEFVPAWDKWKKDHNQVLTLAAQGKVVEAKALSFGAARDSFRVAEELLGKITDINEKGAKEEGIKSLALVKTVKILAISMTVIGFIIAIGIGFYISRNIANILRSLLDESKRLTEAAVEGKLATRGDVEKINFEFRGVVEGVNQTLDAVIGPLNVAGEYVDRISKGDIPPKITDEYKGDFNEIKNNLNQAIEAVSALVADAGMLSKAAVEGKLATRADASKHQGDFQKVVQGVNDCLDSVIGPLNVAAEYVDRISKGDIPPKITDSYNGDFNEIKNNLNQAIEAVNALVNDAGMLSQAAVEGKLATRADASKHQGDFKAIVEGVNQTLDSVIGPLNVAAEYVDRISKGDIPPKITDSYNGDFNEIKNNLNQAIEAVNALVNDAKMLSQAAVDGKLATRADATKHQGDFQAIVEGVNQTLDSVIGPLNVAAEYVDRISKGDIPPKITDNYNGDFNEIKNNLNQAIEAVNALVSDAKMLSQAAVEGKLATRADATKHQGDFKAIVEGVNQTLDSVIGPLNVAAEYVDRISKGDIPPKIADNYNGDFNEIKNNLNVLVDAMNTVTNAAEQIALGDLSVEVQMRSTQDQLMKALNQMVAQLKGLAETAEKIADGDLTVMVKPASDKDMMGNAFTTMVTNLREIVGNVGSSSDSIATATRQIATGNADLAQRTETQASSLEEIASSMEELTSTVKQNADNSQQANQLAIDASDVAVKGGTVITKVVDTMDSISGSSKKIADIISVIDGIAFQTNILALNAAVEAARAGEQGRGFAVVAGEVRNLAQRSAAAAKEIKELISDSVDKVGNGSKLVGEAGQTMQEIVTSIKRVTDIMSEISAASIEQSSGIEQVNGAITSMDEITQQNASVVQQASSAAGALEEQAQLLVEAVNRFKLDEQRKGQLHETAKAQKLEPLVAKAQAASKAGKQAKGVEKTGKANGYHKAATAEEAPLAKAVGHDAEWGEF